MLFMSAKRAYIVLQNWYKRPVAVQYNAVDVFGDLIPEFAAYPDSFRFGGNTNGVNVSQELQCRQRYRAKLTSCRLTLVLTLPT